jgi:two-component system response regulator YesN
MVAQAEGIDNFPEGRPASRIDEESYRCHRGVPPPARRLVEEHMEIVTVGRYVPAVLIIDDDQRVRSCVRRALEPTARVVEAEDGERGLTILEQRARRGRVDRVLADYRLPRRSGLEILQTTKRSWPWIRVVIITGFGSEDLAVEALRAGASDYLKKPVQLDALTKTVAALTGTAGDSADRSTRPPAAHPSIRRALAFMGDHFAETISLADAARAAGLSRFHFCRLFHDETGLPFHEYLHRLRVNRAQVLLADQYLRVSEIAYAVGFNDLSHFDRTFRKLVGHSPREYRTSLRCA